MRCMRALVSCGGVGSTTTDREQRRLAETGDPKNILLSPEPSLKPSTLWRNHCDETVGSRSVDLARLVSVL